MCSEMNSKSSLWELKLNEFNDKDITKIMGNYLCKKIFMKFAMERMRMN